MLHITNIMFEQNRIIFQFDGFISVIVDQLISVEEGLVENGKTSCMKHIEVNNTLKRIIECVKLILLLEMLLFIGWGCYTTWQNCRIESMEVNPIDNISKAESENLFDFKRDKSIINAVERLNKSNDILTENILEFSTEISKIDNEIDTNVNTTEDNLQNVEDDLLSVINNDKKSALEDVESFVVIEDDNLNSTEKEFKENVKTNESRKYDKDSSDDMWTNESSKRSEKDMQHDRQRNLENYSIFLLILENAMRNISISESSITGEDNYKSQDFKVSDEWLNKELTDENREDFLSESHMDVDDRMGEKSEEKIMIRFLEDPNKDVNRNENNNRWNPEQIPDIIYPESDYDANEAFNEKKNISDLSNPGYPDYLYYTY